MTAPRVLSAIPDARLNRRLAGAGALVAALCALSLLSLALRTPAQAGTRTEVLTSKPLPATAAPKTLKVGSEVRTGDQRRRLALEDGSVLYVNQRTGARLTGRRELTLSSGQVFLDVAPQRAAFVVKTPQRQVTARGTRFAVRVEEAGTGVVVASGKVGVSGLDTPLSAGQQLAPGADRPAAAARAAHLLSWTRDLMTAARPALVPASSYAGGALVARDADNSEARLTLRKYHVDLHVEDGFARTTIDQTYFNPSNSRLEGTFYFPLPPDASLSRLAMYVDGSLMEGGMVERDYGRNVFEEIKYRQKDPALLEWVDGSTFKMRVFPLEPRQEKRVLLSYVQRLPSLYGQWTYRFPSGHSLQRVGAWSLHARIKDGARLGWSSPSHHLKAKKEGKDLLLDATERNAKLDRDVVLSVSETAGAAPETEQVRFASAEQDGAKYLMLRYRPGLPGRKERKRRDWVLLFESSGDRNPLLARTQIEMVRGLLANAEVGDTFAVLSAGTRTRTLAPQAQPVNADNVQAAVAFLEKAHLIGALDLSRALADAEPYLKAAQDPYLVHLGSGIAALGEKRAEVMADHLPKGTHYIGIGVGRRWDRAFMKTAAERTDGYYTQVNPDEPIEWRAFELASTLNAPRLLDVRVLDRDGRVSLLPFERLLAQGEELAAVARLEANAALPETVTIRGTLEGKPFVRELAVKDVAANAGYLPRTWAKLEIERLLTENAAKNREAIIALSKAMYVMTPFTSLLVLEDEAMYTQYKVDRGRKDHWAMYACPAKIPVVYEPEDGPVGDPRKGIKPDARQVLKTVVVREKGRDARVAREERFLAVLLSVEKSHVPFPDEAPLAYDVSPPLSPHGMRSSFGFAGDTAGTTSNRGWPRRDGYGPPILSKIPFQDWQLGWSGGRQRVAEATAIQQRAADNVILRQLPLYSGQELSYPALSRAENLRQRGIFEPSRVPEGLPRDFTLGMLPTINASGRHISDQPALLFPGIGLDNLVQFTENRPSSGLSSTPSSRDGLLYNRPSASSDDRLFFDVVAYAPGLNTSLADVQAVLEAEAAPRAGSKRGTIDDGARALLVRSRRAGFRALTLPGEQGRPDLVITFDGQGRFAYERVLPLGLRERVVCDGKTLLHLYPDLGLAARRTVSRFHRLDLAQVVPWFVPQAEDLARGADLTLLDEHTVAIVPHGVKDARDDKGKQLPWLQLRLVFAGDGSLAERQVVAMPSGKVRLRQVCDAAGAIRYFVDGKERDTLKATLADAAAPDLKPSLRQLVVLPLPYRSRAHVLKERGIEKKALNTLSFDDARALLAADFAAGDGNSAQAVFRQALHAREQRQLGLYVLLAACGQNLDAQNLDVQAEHPDSPLAQYLALYSSPVLRQHASRWAVASGSWGEGFLGRLAGTHALLQRWQTNRGTDAQKKADRERALAHVRKHPRSAFSWALLCLLEDRADNDVAAKKDARPTFLALADAWKPFEDVPALAYAARYERARCLVKGGRREEGRRAFRTLYEQTLAKNRLPRIDADLRQALLGTGDEADQWSDLVRQTAARLVKEKRRPAVLVLALQCWQVQDQPLANHLLGLTLEGLPPGKERLPVQAAALRFLWETSQLAAADQLLGKLLADREAARSAALWRFAAQLAARRDMPARELEYLEQALDREYRDLPELVDIKRAREDYGKLLGHYQKLAESLTALKLPTPEGFRDRVVQAADRWRALDPERAEPCELAARVLQTLGGERDLAWDYLTTPVGRKPNESESWVSLAEALGRQGEPTLAERAYAAAFAAEPTNAQVLWDRASNLRQAGRLVEARKLYQQLADGKWQPRFRPLQAQARWMLEGR